MAQALGETPTVQQEVVDNLERYFAGRGIAMPSHNIKQAHLIPSARFVRNRNGTAPGWWVENNGRIVVCMPGPPGEMQPIWHEEVAPLLREMVDEEVTVTRNIKTLGMSEAAIDEEISEFFGHENPYLGIYSKADGIHLRIIARATDEETAHAMIAPVEAAITDRLGAYIWGYDAETPEQAAGQALTDTGLTLATMESCSGGFLANSITDIPGSTGYFKGGIVAMKPEMLLANGVSSHILEEYGAVSEGSCHGDGLCSQGRARGRLWNRHNRSYWARSSGEPTAGSGVRGHCGESVDSEAAISHSTTPNRHQASSGQHSAYGTSKAHCRREPVTP